MKDAQLHLYGLRQRATDDAGRSPPGEDRAPAGAQRRGSPGGSPSRLARPEANPSDAWTELHGLRVLVVEDDFLAARRLRRLLTDLRCEVLGPAPTPAAAQRLLIHDPAAAVLDVHLGPETAFDLALDLTRRGVPVLFVTAEPPTLMPPELRDYPLLSKPFSPWALAEALQRVIA